MSITEETANTQRDTPMDTTDIPQVDEGIPDLTVLTLSEGEETSSVAVSIDNIVKEENDIRSQVSSDTQSDISSAEVSSIPTQQSPQSQNIPPTQKQLLELQHQAAKFSLSLDKMLMAMQCSLTDITNISISCTQLYSDTIDDTCTELDSSIRSMYLIMTKCEALDKQGEAVDQLAKEVHDVNIKLQHLERLYNK